MRSPFSGSNLHRRALCPGSLAMEKDLEEPRDSKEAAEGTMLHELFADPRKTRHRLTAEQWQSLEQVEILQADYFGKIALEYRLPADGATNLVEQEFWFHDGVTALFTNHPDRVFVWPGKVVALIDAKFGYIEVPDAASNYQLAAYLCAVAEEYEADFYYGAIAQPRVGKKFHSVRYTREDLQAARDEIVAIWRSCQNANAPRHPSPDACRYCRGATTGACPDVSLTPAAVAAVWNLEVPPIAKLMSLLPAQRTRLLDMMDLAEDVIGNYKSAAKELLKGNPEAIPDWSLSKGKVLHPITDPATVWQRASERGVPLDKFMGCVEVGKGKLTDELKAATGLKGKGLTAELDVVLAGCVGEKQCEPSLKRTGSAD